MNSVVLNLTARVEVDKRATHEVRQLALTGKLQYPRGAVVDVAVAVVGSAAAARTPQTR